MAEINPQSSNPDKRPRQKKKSTRIDMTAMVDVAFLLLTFFILTTTLASPQVMPFVKPPLEETMTNPPVKASKCITFILGKNDQVHYYTGEMGEKLQTTDFSADGLRSVVSHHIHKYPNRCGKGQQKGCWDPIVLIKAEQGSRYKNLVDILDEMRIAQVPKYAMGDLAFEEERLIAQLEAR